MVVATCNGEISSETELRRFAYNRVNNGKSFINMFNQLQNKTFDEIKSFIKQNKGYEIKSWDDNGICHYDPFTLRDTKGRHQKLRHSLNPDGSYYKKEFCSLDSIKNKTNAHGVFIITPDNTLYYYDDAFFGTVEEFFETAK